MSKKYDEIMNRISVNDEMRERILQNVNEASAEDEKKIVRFPSAAKKIIPFAACLAVVIIGALTVPGLIQRDDGGYTETSPMVGNGTEAPVLGGDAAEDGLEEETLYFADNSALYRKSEGTRENSGDYNTYSDNIFIDVNGTEVNLRGDDSLYKLAVWTKDGYSYSLSLENGVSQEDFEEILLTLQ